MCVCVCVCETQPLGATFKPGHRDINKLIITTKIHQNRPEKRLQRGVEFAKSDRIRKGQKERQTQKQKERVHTSVLQTHDSFALGYG